MLNGKPLAIAPMPYNRPWNNVELIKDCGLVPFLFARDFGFEVHMIGLAPEGVEPGLYGPEDIEKFSKAYPYYSYVSDMKLRLLSDYSPDAREALMREYAPEAELLILRGPYPASISFAKTYRSLNPSGKIYCGLDANSSWMDRIAWHEPSFRNFLETVDVLATSCTAMGALLSKKWPRHVWSVFNGNMDLTGGFAEFAPYSERTNTILTVGRLGTEQKATTVLLNAFVQIEKDCPDWKLELVGSETPEFHALLQNFLQDRPDLKDRIIERGEIRDRGELCRVYKRAKIFALPSTLEGGTPNAAADALKAGLAMAVTTVDAYEDMTDEGRCGLASPVGDAEAFGENLKSLCRDPALETKGKDAFTHAQAVYDMPKDVARLHTLLFGDMETVSLLQYEEEELYHRHEEVYWKDIPADFFKPVRNRSRLCLYSEDGTPSAYALCQKLRMLNPGRELLLNLLIGMLLHFPGTSSLRVLEIGCGRGELSPLISGAAAGFYSGNRYTAVTDCLGGENEDRWTANVTRADFPAGISYLIADFADTNLQTASFELVLINGWATAFSDPGGSACRGGPSSQKAGLYPLYPVRRFRAEYGF